MRYLGDISVDAIIRGSFNTRVSDGTPITLSGTPSLAVYRDAGVAESAEGVTLTLDFDGLTGLHLYAIDTSANAFYQSGADYRVVIASGTVDGISVVGTEVGQFSIQNRFNDSNGIATLLERITGLLQTKAEADTDQTAVIAALGNVPTVDEISFSIASDVINDDNEWDNAKESLVDQIWGTTNRTLTSIADSTGMTTLLTRITGLLQTKVQADTDQTAVISAVDNVPTAAEIVSGIRDDSAPYSPSNINLTRKIGSIQPIYIAWATTGATITGTKSINGGPVSSIVGSSVEMSPQPDWDIPPGKFWYELEYDPSDRILSPAIIEYELTDGTESQTIAVAIVR